MDPSCLAQNLALARKRPFRTCGTLHEKLTISNRFVGWSALQTEQEGGDASITCKHSVRSQYSAKPMTLP